MFMNQTYMELDLYVAIVCLRNCKAKEKKKVAILIRTVCVFFFHNHSGEKLIDRGSYFSNQQSNYKVSLWSQRL